LLNFLLADHIPGDDKDIDGIYPTSESEEPESEDEMEDEGGLEPEPNPQTADPTNDNETGMVPEEDLEPDVSPLLNHAQQAEVERSQEPGPLLEIETFGGKAGKPIKLGQPANGTQWGSSAGSANQCCDRDSSTNRCDRDGGTNCCDRNGGTNRYDHDGGTNHCDCDGRTIHGGNVIGSRGTEHGGIEHSGMEHNGANPYAPFLSRTDWEIAKWGKLRGPSSTAFTELLEIPGVSSYEQRS
jgi:hypothetical protein